MYMKDIIHKITTNKNKIVVEIDKIHCIRQRLHPWVIEECINRSILFPVFEAKMTKKFKLIITKQVTTPCPWEDIMDFIQNIKIRGEEGVNAFDADSELQLNGTSLTEEFIKLNPHSLTLKSNNIFVDKRIFLLKQINDFFIYNLNQQTLLNSIESNLNNG